MKTSKNVYLVIILILIIGAGVYFYSNKIQSSQEKLFTVGQGLILKLPVRSIINGNIISLDDSEFQISGGAAPPCGSEEPGSSTTNCVFTDITSNGVPIKLWQNSSGVFALASSYIVRKNKPNQIFTPDEVVLWTEIIGTTFTK